MTNIIEKPGASLIIGDESSVIHRTTTPAQPSNTVTVALEFDQVKHLLTDAPLRRNSRIAAPPDLLQTLTPPNSVLKELAKSRKPPEWWFEDDEACPF